MSDTIDEKISRMNEINNKDGWIKMVRDSREESEDFRDMPSDNHVLWANDQIESYKRSMMALVSSNSDWGMGVSEDDRKLIETMINKAESYQCLS